MRTTSFLGRADENHITRMDGIRTLDGLTLLDSNLLHLNFPIHS